MPILFAGTTFMPLRIKCPSGHSLIVSESRAGQSFRCPKCQGEVRVPAAVAKPPQPSYEKKQETFEKSPATKTPAPKPPVATVPKPKVQELWRKDEPPAPVMVVPPVAPPIPPPPLPVPTTLARMENNIASEVEPPPVILRVPQSPTEPPPLPSTPAKSVPPLVSRPLEPIAPLPPTPPTLPEIAAFPIAASEPAPTPSATPVPPLPSSQPAPSTPPPRLPPPAPAVELLPPLVHSSQQIAVVFQLAAAMVVAALFSVFPSAWDLVVYVNGTSASPVGRWAIVLAMLGAVQVAYAIYLFQLPDWTTVWMVTLFALASAALYAMALGLTIISGEDGWLVRFLQLSDKVAGGKAALWCLCMMSVMTLLAFFAGRISVRWRQTEAVLREAA
ncbi:MAG: hypothetical protein ACKVP0_10690 [Pirellulaceae bacterium]